MSKDISEWILRIQLMLGLVFCLQACAFPFPPTTETTYISRDERAFLETGQTTKAEVREHLNEPEVTFDSDSTWLYTTRTGHSGGVAYCSPFNCILQYPVWDETGYKPTEYFLILDFNTNDVLIAKTEFSVVRGKCKQNKMCRYSGELILYASKAADDDVKHFRVDGEQCAVYLFATLRQENLLRRFTIQIDDDRRTEFKLLDNDVYLHRYLPAGRHRITAHSAALDVDCAAGEIIYVCLGSNDNDSVSLALGSSDDSQKEILKRKLIITADH